MLEVHVFECHCGTLVIDVAYSYRTESDYFAPLCGGRVSLLTGEGLNVTAWCLLLVWPSIIWLVDLSGVLVSFYACCALSLRVAEIGLH